MSDVQLAELVRHLDENRRALRAAVDAVPPADRTRRPAPDRWSVLEVVEHVAIVEKAITRRLTDLLEGMPSDASASTTGTAPTTDRAFVRSVGNRTNRFKTGRNSEPRGGLDTEAAWALVTASREAFRQLLERAAGRDVSAIAFPHPFLGTLSFYQWADFISGHDARHAEQIREIGSTFTSLL